MYGESIYPTSFDFEVQLFRLWHDSSTNSYFSVAWVVLLVQHQCAFGEDTLSAFVSTFSVESD